MDFVDLVVVGAGFRGLAVAKTYRQVHPDSRVLMFDSADTVGGCWAMERLYPSLRTNNPMGTYDFSDFEMTPELAGVEYGEHIPGVGVHRYLSAAARFYGLESCLRLGTKVQSALLKTDDSWEISYTNKASPTAVDKVGARKLVVATGAASNPSMPLFPGQDDFKGLLIHYAQLNTHSERLSQAKNVVVVGAGKAAMDASYLVAQNGSTAHMIIRPSGGGPSYAWSLIKFLGRITVLPLLVTTRFYTLFDPWPFARQNRWIRNFFHRWTVGLAVTKAFWSNLGASYSRMLEDDPRTAKLIPWSSPYWMGSSLSVQNYPTDWMALVREGRIVVHHADVTSLNVNSVQLTDGPVSNVDAVVCCTGWKHAPHVKFLPPEIEETIGLPSMQPLENKETILEIRKDLYNRRPFLRNSARDVRDRNGSATSPINSGSPFRLYRYLAPCSERFMTARNLAIGSADNPLLFTISAEVQALWTVAFLDGKLLRCDDIRKVQRETTTWSEYERIRRPAIAGGQGETIGDFVFDCLPYLDSLMEDLGLRSRRKKTFYQEWFTPYGKEDYKGIVDEWMESVAQREKQRSGSTDK